MEYQNVIHPEADYRKFGAALIAADPILDDQLEDQDVINMYNSILEKDPNITIAQILEIIPKIVPQIRAKVDSGNAPVQDKASKLEALKAMRG